MTIQDLKINFPVVSNCNTNGKVIDINEKNKSFQIQWVSKACTWHNESDLHISIHSRYNQDKQYF